MSQRKETRRIELIETHNIALSIEMMQKSGYWQPWRRALYHALSMAEVDKTILVKIREALGLP